jgi:hypothetical protein
LNRKTMLPLLAVTGVLALSAGAATASANSAAPITVQSLVSRIQNGLKCLSSWHSLYEADGTTQFKSVIGCVLYAAEGGQFGTPPPAIPAPTITSAALESSCEVAITGTGLAGATSVTFGSRAPITSFDTDTATEIDVPGDPLVAGVTVTVTTPGGSASTVIGSSCGGVGGGTPPLSS